MKFTYLKFSLLMLLYWKSIYSIWSSGVFFGVGGGMHAYFFCYACCVPRNCRGTAVLNNELYSEQNLLERWFIFDFKTFTVCKIKYIILFTFSVSRIFFFLKNFIYANTFNVSFSFILQTSCQIIHAIFRFANKHNFLSRNLLVIRLSICHWAPQGFPQMAKRLGIESTTNVCHVHGVVSSVFRSFPLCNGSLRTFTLLSSSLKFDVFCLLDPLAGLHWMFTNEHDSFAVNLNSDRETGLSAWCY